MTKRRRKVLAAVSDNEATSEEIARMMRSQAGTVTQSDIPPHLDVYATMEAAWAALLSRVPFHDPKIAEDAKFVFYNGIQAAANLCIFCAGQDKFEAAADQITAECIAYEKEAEAVLRRRRLDDGPNGADITGAPTSH